MASLQPQGQAQARAQRAPFTIDTRAYSYQPESDDDDDELAPPSPASDTSAGSWGKMSQLSCGPPGNTRHPHYYIDSGDVVFLVESQLFKVHKYFFVRESKTFRDILASPTAARRGGSPAKGSSDACPVELREITAKEFSRFLWVFYNPEYSYAASIPKWSSILRLSHLYNFPSIKNLAIREMDKLDISPVDKAVMAREFQVDPARRWLDTAYAALGAREEPITKEEGVRLGLDVVLHLAEVRERIRARRRLARAESRVHSPPTPPLPLTVSQQIGRHDLFAPPSQQAPDAHTWRSYPTTGESPPASPVESERSYGSVVQESRYVQRTPPPPPRSQYNSSMSPQSLTTRPPSRSRSYTEDDVADVRTVFAT